MSCARGRLDLERVAGVLDQVDVDVVPARADAGHRRADLQVVRGDERGVPVTGRRAADGACQDVAARVADIGLAERVVDRPVEQDVGARGPLQGHQRGCHVLEDGEPGRRQEVHRRRVEVDRRLAGGVDDADVVDLERQRRLVDDRHVLVVLPEAEGAPVVRPDVGAAADGPAARVHLDVPDGRVDDVRDDAVEVGAGRRVGDAAEAARDGAVDRDVDRLDRLPVGPDQQVRARPVVDDHVGVPDDVVTGVVVDDVRLVLRLDIEREVVVTDVLQRRVEAVVVLVDAVDEARAGRDHDALVAGCGVVQRDVRGIAATAMGRCSSRTSHCCRCCGSRRGARPAHRRRSGRSRPCATRSSRRGVPWRSSGRCSSPRRRRSRRRR